MFRKSASVCHRNIVLHDSVVPKNGVFFQDLLILSTMDFHNNHAERNTFYAKTPFLKT